MTWFRPAARYVRKRARAPSRGRWPLFAALPTLLGLAAARGFVEHDPVPPAGAEVPPPSTANLPRVVAEPSPAARVEIAVAEPPRGAAPPLPPQDPQDPQDPPPCEHTPLSRQALAEALRVGHIRQFGAPPNLDRWACAWAHCAFESDRGRAIYGNNLGHVTSRQVEGKVCRRRIRERIARNPDRWELVDVSFHAFDTPEDGAAAYWRLLSESYYSVLARCDDADARGAAQRLAAIGYFTGPEEPYIDSMARLFVQARGALIPRLLSSEGGRAASPR